MRPKLVCVSGPRGAGKETLMNYLCREFPKLRRIVPHTTRPPRPMEEDGREYHFVPAARFQELLAAGEFVFHDRYGEVQWSGTVKEEFFKSSCSIVDVSPKGARVMREKLENGFNGSSFLIFIHAPAWMRRERIRARDPRLDVCGLEKLMSEDPVDPDPTRYRDYNLRTCNDRSFEVVGKEAWERIRRFLSV